MNDSPATSPGGTSITELTIEGFKSIRDKIVLPVKPLTVLAGANSSGKTSLMQPLLLLKQTLEAPYDPGPLLLNGPHVAFQRVRELIPACWHDQPEVHMTFSVNAEGHEISPSFKLRPSTAPGIELVYNGQLEQIIESNIKVGQGTSEQWKRERQRFSWFATLNDAKIGNITTGSLRGTIPLPWCLHLPGLRGRPERAYPLTGAGPLFPGPFPPYTASVIAGWQRLGESRLANVRRELAFLKLTSTVKAVEINDTQVALQVGRLLAGQQQTAADLVDISDVGVGVSQVLPVIVALYAAAPGALVYIEQPELHLHPRAQVALAGVLVRALQRGIRLVIETHSSLLLTGIQTEVAEGRLKPDDVNLSWVERNEEGWTRVRQADLKDDGTFGDWPIDFDDVQLEAGSRFLDAVDRKHWGPDAPGS